MRLLSIGEEPEKGNQLTLEAYGLLETGAVGFAGNAESRDLLAGAGDVIVCDGFTGNIVLKLLEGTIKTMLDALRTEVLATPRGQAGRVPHPARGAGGCGRSSIPTRTAARTCSASAASR